MAKYKDINQYRRNKKMKNVSKKILLILFIFGALIIVLNIFQISGNSILSSFIHPIGQNENNAQSKYSFPITIKNEQMVSLTELNNDNIAVLTKSSVMLYDTNGKKNSSFIHGYTKPVVKTNERRILTYDRGGYNLRVDSPSSHIGELKFNNTIITAEIAPSGNIVVVLVHDKYECEVQVYTANLRTRVYQYYATDEFSGVSFSPDEKMLAAFSICDVNGIISAKLYQMNVESTENAQIDIIKNIVPLSVCYSNDGYIKLTGQNVYISYNVKSKEQKVHTYKGDLLHFEDDNLNGVMLVNKNLISGYSTLSLLSPNGDIIKTSSISDDFVDMYTNGNVIAILNKTSFYCFDTSLNELKTFNLGKISQKIICTDKDVYVMGTDVIEKFSL